MNLSWAVLDSTNVKKTFPECRENYSDLILKLLEPKTRLPQGVLLTTPSSNTPIIPTHY